MYVRVECYPVLDRLHVSLVVLDRVDSPAGMGWEAVWAASTDPLVGDRTSPQDMVQGLAEALMDCAAGF